MPIALFTAMLLFVQSAFAEQLLRDVHVVNRERICMEAYRELGIREKKVKAEVIHPEMKNEKFYLPDIPGYQKDAIYIGIANHFKDGNHHYYVDVGKVQASSHGFLGSKIIDNGRIASNGALFEIPVPPEVAKAIEARALAGKFSGTLSCLHAVCNLLEPEGVVIHERGGKRKVRTRVVLANLVEGKIKILGKDADPETIRLLTTGDSELAHLLYTGTITDAKGEREALLFIGGGGGTVVLVGLVGSIYSYSNSVKQQVIQEREKLKYRPLGNED
jgi:hypothetical protein